jgi:hypothetical protein
METVIGCAFVIVEHRELTLSFEGARISKRIRIIHDTQIHLVACAEISKVTRIADTQKTAGVER